MDRPEERYGQGEPGGVLPVAGPEPFQEERPPDDPEEEEPRQEMDDQVEEVVACGVEAADRVVKRQAVPDQGAAGAGDYLARRPEPPDRLVLDDPGDVVEDKRSPETVEIDEGPDRDQTEHRDQSPLPGI